MRTTLSRVLHFGAAGGGTEHFWRQRVTAAANVILVSGFIIVMMMSVGRPHAEVATLIGSPLVAALMVLLFVSVTIHMRLGVQTFVEDYVHTEGLKIVLLVAATFFSAGIGVVAIMAVLSLAFGG
jgi:succinate dehydrogenase / fumarate reductase membrane anchor subunit